MTPGLSYDYYCGGRRKKKGEDDAWDGKTTNKHKQTVFAMCVFEFFCGPPGCPPKMCVRTSRVFSAVCAGWCFTPIGE